MHAEKALYGLKQSGRQWYIKLDSELKTLGFVSSEADSCICTLKRGRDKIILGLFVDDLLMAYSCKKLLKEIIEKLTAKFDIGTAKEFLGTQIEKKEN